MKKIIYLFLFVILTACDSIEYKTEFYPDGKVKAKYEMKDGKLSGSYLLFYPSEKIKIKTNYDNNLLNGPYEEYYESGLLKVKGNYILDKKSGFFSYYDSNGIKDSIGQYILLYCDREYILNNGNSSFEFDEDSIEKKDSYLNTFLIYDDNGKVVKDKSSYISVKLLNDTLESINDTLITNLVLYNPPYNKKCNYSLYVRKLDKNSNFLTYERYKYDYSKRESIILKRPDNKGVNYFQGLILMFEEDNASEPIHVFYFKEPYYVK